VTDEETCVEEVNATVAMAKVAFNKSNEVLVTGFKKTLKKSMVKSLVWPIALYGCETWTVKRKQWIC
jgi:hypothetical protein